jgi:hypothetical protein
MIPLGAVAVGAVAAGTFTHGAFALGTAGMLDADVPVDPNSDQARQWIIEELSKPAYQAAQPNWFDRASSAFYDWISSLDFSRLGGAQAPILLILAGIVVAAIIAAFLIFGRARLNRRSALGGGLFGEEDERDAVAIRVAAESAASRGDWTLAIIEMFRAIARGLAERTVVAPHPGTTAHDVAADAGRAFPAAAERLRTVAAAFDRVRYLGRPGSERDFLDAAALESELRKSSPALRDDPLRSAAL